MSLDQLKASALPSVLRPAGLWLIWSAWCSAGGWLLSAAHALDGYGYAALTPLLLVAWWFWLKSISSANPAGQPLSAKLWRRLRQPAPLIYFAIAALSLLGGLLYTPWSADATIYRLPRMFYWWWAHHWYWIGTLDHRLDFSSTGFEWQMLPVILLTRGDRLLFLINWLPFLLLPGLVFVAFRALGVNGRSARRWMWLLPAAYGIALQSGSIQNDGYSVNFLLASAVFAVFGWRTQRPGLVLMSVLAAALLTGAKVSNLPLLLPLGALLLPALRPSCLLNWKVPLVLVIALLCSSVPMSFLSWKHTGDWAGDPSDQWTVKTHGVAAAGLANVVIFLNDAAQPPYLPGSRAINARIEAFNNGPFINKLEQANREFMGVHFGETVYEGNAGLGFGIAAYLAILLLGSLFVAGRAGPPSASLPWVIRLAPWLAWASYAVFLVKLGSNHSARIAMPYYPLLLIPLLRCPKIAAFERGNFSGLAAGLAAFSVLPIILTTPVRPLVPVQAIARATHSHGLARLAGQYAFWGWLRDNQAPLRAQLPPEATRLGYAAGFLDTPYGLFKPFGTRTIVELGLPPGSGNPVPADLKYAVVTERGLQQRGQPGLKTWLERSGGQIIFTNQHNDVLDAHTPAKYESWYLVKLNPPATNQLDAPHESTR
jgi:hypothetical protein